MVLSRSKKGKSQRRGSRSRAIKRTDIKNFRWPPFLQESDMHFLIQRVEQASTDEIEHRLFMTILQRAYEDVLELKTLYHELPGVLTDDRLSTSNFKEIIKRSALIRTDTKSRTIGITRSQCDDEHKVDLGSLGNFLYKPVFFIKPSRLSLIMAGVERVSAGDNGVYNRYLKTIAELWDKTRPLERLYRKALRGIEANDRDPLGEYLRLVARDCRITASHGEEQKDTAVVERSNLSALSLSNSYTNRASTSIGPWALLPAVQTIRWPPPDDDVPIDSDDTDLCRKAALIGSRRIRPLPTSTYADGVTSISPTSACEGQTIDINGAGFGPSKPVDVNVMIGSKIAQVASWSDSRIVVTISQGTTSGCVGFRNEKIEDDRKRIHSENESIRQEIAAVCGYDGVGIPYVESVPPCTGSNSFAGTLPEIDRFLVNGRTDLTVPSNVMLTFTWQVRNAMTFRIRRISPDGPPVDITDPPGNSLDFGPFTERRPLDAVYELSATNTCSTVSRNVYVHLRENPTLKILGIELIQVIQRFNLSSPSQNNSVRLRDRKRTIARLYIDSGISNGFDNGFGPNNQPFVTGSVAVFQQMAGRSFDAGPPLNVGGTVVAQPPNNIDRNDITHTLNFELPMQQLVGNIRIEAKVWVRDHESDVGSGWHGQFTYTGIHFHLSGRQILVRILVRDNHHLLSPAIKNPPDVLEYNISLRGARARMPISEDGFVIHLAPGFETINCNHDLRTKKGWNDLLDDIDDIAGEFEDLGQIWTALVPAAGIGYYVAGIANQGLKKVIPPWFEFPNRYPRMIAQAALPSTFAHEIGHTLGFGHAPCSPPGEALPDNIDPRLPGHTEDVGLDVQSLQLIPAGIGEVMSYCDDERSWPSIVFWNSSFDLFTLKVG